MTPIYLDNNAGAPLRPEAREAIARFARGGAGNPSSVHRDGQLARRALEHAREQVAALIGADPRNIVFTSGGTESNNLAIMGSIDAPRAHRRIISSAIEHSSILAPPAELERRGLEVIRVAPDRDGRLDAAEIHRTLDGSVALVTLGLANSEVGTIQPLDGLASAIAATGALFHIDAAQALGRMRVALGELRCDLMTLSGHKFGAPAGIGALYVSDRSRIAPVMLGGPQEAGLRAGTPNLLGAIAMGAAAEAVAANLDAEIVQMRTLAETMLTTLRASIPGLRLNGSEHGRIPNTLNLTFPGVLGESMLIALDLEGVRVSMGSACAAGAVEPSHVLLAMGRSAAEARSSLRISLGWATTAVEIDRACETIVRVWRRVLAAEPSRIEEPASAAEAHR